MEVGSHEALMADDESQYRQYVMLQDVDSSEDR